KEPGQPRREAEEGAERQRRASAQSDPSETERGGRCERRGRGEEDDLRQRRKPEPRARRGEQLGVALAEALTAAVTLIGPGDGSQHEIADRSGRGPVGEVFGIECNANDQTKHEQRDRKSTRLNSSHVTIS